MSEVKLTAPFPQQGLVTVNHSQKSEMHADLDGMQFVETEPKKCVYYCLCSLGHPFGILICHLIALPSLPGLHKELLILVYLAQICSSFFFQVGAKA